jgi:hypothetical protein
VLDIGNFNTINFDKNARLELNFEFYSHKEDNANYNILESDTQGLHLPRTLFRFLNHLFWEFSFIVLGYATFFLDRNQDRSFFPLSLPTLPFAVLYFLRNLFLYWKIFSTAANAIPEPQPLPQIHERQLKSFIYFTVISAISLIYFITSHAVFRDKLVQVIIGVLVSLVFIVVDVVMLSRCNVNSSQKIFLTAHLILWAIQLWYFIFYLVLSLSK